MDYDQYLEECKKIKERNYLLNTHKPQVSEN